MPQPNDPITTPQNSRWGAAAKYAFDDPNKWVTISSVPLLDEHEMTNDQGRPVATVDRAALEEIARNNNRRVYETGDPATLILGHTSDDPRAAEKPAKGFVVNYAVKPFKRDESGRVIYAIHGDYKLRPQNAGLVEEYPRRSVELWWHKKELDPIAMLGGSSPERDLGVVIRNGRINHVTIDHKARRTGTRTNQTSDDDVIRFHSRGQYTIESYSIEVPQMTQRRNTRGQPDRRYNCGPGGRPMQYTDDGMDTDDFDGGDGAVDDGPDAGNEDPTVAKVMQSKQMKDLFAKIDMIAQAVGVGGGDEPGGPGDLGGAGDDGMGGEMPPPGAGGEPPMGPGGMGGGEGGDMPPGPGGGGEPPMPPGGETDARRMHGDSPVQMNAGPSSTGFPGPSNGFIPGMGGKKGGPPVGRMSRNGSQPMTGQRTRSRGVDPRDVQIIRLRRSLAQRDAEKIIDDLEREGVIFGRDPQQAEKIKFARIEELTLAILHDEDTKDAGSPDSYVADKIDEMRTCYARRSTDTEGRRRPPQSSGVARFARNPVQEAGAKADAAEADEFTPTSDEQVCEMADLQHQRKMPWNEVQKYMRKKYGSLR